MEKRRYHSKAMSMIYPSNVGSAPGRRLLVGAVLAPALICVVALVSLFGYKSQADALQESNKVAGAGIGECKTALTGCLEREKAIAADMSKHKTQIAEASERQAQLTRENNDLKVENATLKSASAQQGRQPLSEEQIQNLKGKGLEGSTNDLVSDLMKHNELIPYDGVLGGRMCFCFADGIQVLNGRWVSAYFEDGHIAGRILLAYKIASDGEITWSVIESCLDCS